jgi:hypothetical protein
MKDIKLDRIYETLALRQLKCQLTGNAQIAKEKRIDDVAQLNAIAPKTLKRDHLIE